MLFSFENYTDGIQNKLINAFYKDEYEIVALKYQLLCAKVQSILVPPPQFRLGPPHFVCSGDGTASSVWLSRSYSIYRNQGLKI